MKYADAVLVAIPATYLLVAAVLFPFEVNVYHAVLVASLSVAAILAQALLIDPPT